MQIGRGGEGEMLARARELLVRQTGREIAVRQVRGTGKHDKRGERDGEKGMQDHTGQGRSPGTKIS